MDPKRRAQCSDLLEHPLFTQDSFNIRYSFNLENASLSSIYSKSFDFLYFYLHRFLDELKTKILKDHRENCTLPKIPKTTTQEKEKGDDKNNRSKDKKQLEERLEKVNTEKMEKTKGKQSSKLSKSFHTTTESFVTKQPKPFGNKGIHHTEQFSVKPGKTSGSELKEFEVLKSTKMCVSASSDVSKKTISLKKKSSAVTKPKHESNVSPDARKDHLPNAKDKDSINPGSEKTMTVIRESSKSETSKEFVRSLSNLSLKVSKLSKMSITDGQSLNQSPKTYLELDTNVAPTCPRLSINDYTTSTMFDITKSGKSSLASKFPIDILEDDAEQDTSEGQKAQAKNSRKSQPISTSGQHNHTSFSPSRAVVDVSKQSFMAVTEANAAHSPSNLPRGISHLKTTCTAKSPSKDDGPTEDQDVRKYHRYLRLNPMTKTPTKAIRSSHVLGGDPESSLSYLLGRHSNTILVEEKFTSTSVLDEDLSVEKGLTVSENNNPEDLASSVSINSPANALVNKILKAPERSANEKRNNSIHEFKSDSNSSNISHFNQNPTATQSFSNHMRSFVNPKTQNYTFTPDTRKRCNKLEGNGTNTTGSTSVMSVDHKALTRSLVLNKKEEFDCTGLRSCTPSPPPTPATNRLHHPPSSKTLTPSIFVSSANQPAVIDHFLLGGDIHIGTNSLW